MSYNLQRYMFDAFKLKLLNTELKELTVNYGMCKWARERMIIISADIAVIKQNMTRYETLPKNRE